MAEDKIIEIYEELFKGNNSALAKCAKVRHTLYEIGLWYKPEKGCRKLELSEVSDEAKDYFKKRFLDGKWIEDVEKNDPKALEDAWTRLYNAANSRKGCKARCTRLLEELNREFEKHGMEPVEIKSFLEWLTYSYSIHQDCYTGSTILEPRYGFEVRVFHDAENRREYWDIVKKQLKKRHLMHPGTIGKIVVLQRQYKDF